MKLLVKIFQLLIPLGKNISFGKFLISHFWF
jgi:hypothetical protein